jgi:hypothetical protein
MDALDELLAAEEFDGGWRIDDRRSPASFRKIT